MEKQSAGKRILVILGHPAEQSFCGALAQAYATGAKEAGHTVRWLEVGKLAFDHVLHNGYRTVQPLEPDLQAARADILWATHLLVAYPVWWGAMPALLKGFFDRVFLPGFAFRYREGSRFWDRLLSGRSAHVITTMDTPPWYYRLVYRMPGHHQIKRTILEFSGIRPVTIASYGAVKTSTPQQRDKWLANMPDYPYSFLTCSTTLDRPPCNSPNPGSAPSATRHSPHNSWPTL